MNTTECTYQKCKHSEKDSLTVSDLIFIKILSFIFIFLDWVWNKHNPDEDYIKVLKMFLDKKDSSYSIHQIGEFKTRLSG